MIRSTFGLALIAVAVAAAWCASENTSPAPPAETPPPGVMQVLPRGAIRAIFEPRFVGAAEAEIPDDARVLGVLVEGVAKAYSLALLTRREVVNDRSGNTAFAAVW